MTVHLHRFDLPEGLTFEGALAVDTETLGLNPFRDRLCLVQLSAGNGTAHLVQFPEPRYDAPRLKSVLADPGLVKIFHYARFDLATLFHHLGVMATPCYCTKIASKLTRTYTDKHGLKDLVKELLGHDLSKQSQSSDWGAPELSDAQQSYAASDVLYLHALKDQLDARLAREGRTELARACFDFLPTRARLDLAGWSGEDIFSH